MTYEYIFPKKIKNKKAIYEFFSVVWNTYKDVYDSTIYINMDSTRWIDLNMIAPLGLILEDIKGRNNNIFFRNLSRPILKLLADYDFINLQNLKKRKFSLQYNQITYHKLSADDTDSFNIYINDKFNELINIDNNIQVFVTRLTEIFINVRMHARKNIHFNTYGDKEVFCSGYFNKSDNTLFFSIANQGQTFKENIVKYTKRRISKESTYISWATEESFTTRRDSPGGLGLYMLKNFITDLHGELIIQSGKGFWSLSDNEVISEDFACAFPGTVVSVRIPINKLNSIRNPFIDEKILLSIDDLIGM